MQGGDPPIRAKVLMRDLQIRRWTGLWDLITWGQGYACVSTDAGLWWLPARCVKPVLDPRIDKRTSDTSCSPEPLRGESEHLGDPDTEPELDAALCLLNST